MVRLHHSVVRPVRRLSADPRCSDSAPLTGIPVNKQSSFSYNELVDCAKGHLFGEGNAQLPLPPMLMFDRITTITDNGGLFGKGEVIAELDISPDLWFFACHFNNDPVMPGCLGLERLQGQGPRARRGNQVQRLGVSNREKGHLRTADQARDRSPVDHGNRRRLRVRRRRKNLRGQGY
jgi:3-hydroxymyristoyl/3-hydroxydecanoyl-(acyl carrier protein) dehydratase